MANENYTSGWGTSDYSSGFGDLGQNTLPQGSILQARYEVLKVLGVGGMGAVYLAQDLRFTGVVRHCAVKEMVIATPDPQTRHVAMQNFNREANLLVQLSNPGIPKIYDFFNEANRSYLVMEYVDGKDLETILENSDDQLDEVTVLDWALQICDVLNYLHNQKPPIIFRDLKPANIMLRKQNRIALIDFGIAKAFESGQKGTMIGTEGYSPPEQYQGVASPKVDIYALGATLHHLLTKRDPRLEPPFTFQEALPNSINPDLSQETGAIIMKALEYSPNSRYSSASVFREALSKIIEKSGGTVSSSAPMATKVLPDTNPNMVNPTPAPAPPPVQQYPPQAAYPPNYPPPGYPAQYPPNYPPPGYPAQYPPGYAPPGYPVEEVEPEETITPIWTFKCEDEVRGSASADKNNLYIGSYDHNLYAIDLKTGEFQWKFATDGGIATRPHVSDNRIIFGSEDQVLYAISARRGSMMWTCPTQGRIRSSATVEFGRVFFGSDDGHVYAISAENGRVVWDYEAIDPIRSTPVLGDELLFVGTEAGDFLALELRTGGLKWKHRAKRAITSSPTRHKEKNILVVGSSDRAIYGLNAKNGYELWQIRTKQAVISSPTIYEDIAYIGGADKNLYAINVETGRQLWKYEADAPIISTPAVTDEAIYFGTTDGDVISIERGNRKLRWRFKTDGPVPSSPLVVDDIVYIGSNDHSVYALPA
ncbi:serine/threonine-protein kinase [Anaerolineales bacterium HSG25]|nr:serine/threonine-protein kinase [Anaerolineales bacterium HSG25]